MPPPRLDPQHTALLVVDMQEKLLPHMQGPDELTSRVGLAVNCFHALEMPVIATEQYPEGLGPTQVPAIADHDERLALRASKTRFSALVEPVADLLRARTIRSVLVCGIEAHVCVLQTCLDLIGAGYVTAVAFDGISSRRSADLAAARHRLVQAGAIASSVESAVLEIVGDARNERFRTVLPIIK